MRNQVILIFFIILSIITTLLAEEVELLSPNKITKFKIEQNSPENFVNRYVKTVQETLDLDKLIDEEEIKLKFGDKIPKPEIVNSGPIKKKRIMI